MILVLRSIAAALPGGRQAVEWVAALRAEAGRTFRHGRFPRYRRWLRRVHEPALSSCQPPVQPLISILTPAFNPDPEQLRVLQDSLKRQDYRNWEWVICDDGSTQAASLRALSKVESGAARLHRHEDNQGISAATNTALAAARGEVVCFVDQDDRLSPGALTVIAAAFADQPNLQLVYTDEDKLSGVRRSGPAFKPAFDRALLYRRNYINHLTAVRTGLARRLKGLDSACDGAQDYDFVLRAFEAAGAAAIGHAPYIAYSWRSGGKARGVSATRRDAAAAARQHALAAHLERIGQPAEIGIAGDDLSPRWRVSEPPRIDVVIPTRDRLSLLERCVEDARAGAEGIEARFIIVDNDSEDPATHDWFEGQESIDDTEIVRAPGPFNFSRLVNTGAARGGGGLILLLNNDVQGGEAGWMRRLAEEALRPWAGAVGPKLVFPDGRIQHGVVVVGMGGSAGHFMKGARGREAGPDGRLSVTRSVSALTGACLMTPRAVFDRLGGFDEGFPGAFNDIDYCLRVWRAGLECIFTPDVTLQHLEGASRGRETAADAAFCSAAAAFRKRWGRVIAGDPFFNPNLSPDSEIARLNPSPPCLRVRSRAVLTPGAQSDTGASQ